MDVATQQPLGFPVGGYPGPQGLYYCSVGGKNTHGRAMVEEHADMCLEAGINFEGINQEVAAGSGNSRSLPRAPSAQATNSGWPDTSSIA